MKTSRTIRAGLLVLAMLAASSAEAAGRQVLRHRFAALTGALQAVERLPATNQLHAALCLPLRNAAALTNLLQQLYNPASPNYRRYLTPEAFTEQFGPTREDYAAVVAYAQAHGLKVTTTHPNRMLVDVDGTAADFERAFQTSLRVYRHPRDNRMFHAPDLAPSLDLAVPVLSVCGLDNYAVPRPAGLRPVPAPAAQAAPMAGSGPSGNLMGTDFRKAYAPGVTLTGTGQSVGLLQFDGYYASDIASYVSQAGLPSVPLQKVLINGFSGNPGINNGEVAMDIEMVISMAPGLDRILVYEGSPYGTAISILNRMATDNAAKQLSASWTWGTLDPGTEQVFQQFAAQGQSYFNASGDSDAYTGAIDAPADNPYITIVGGTTLATGAGGTWSSETTWNWGGGTGSGGGSSTTYPIPDWQQGVDMTANHGSTTKRNIPDVAMAADDIWVIYDNGSSGAFGGTSASAPLWAGFTALINQQALARGLPTVGFLNPAVYALGASSRYASAFHDITTGNNTSSSSPTKFQAVAGYDLCTGWGTPAGQPLIDALSSPPEPLVVTPASIVSASGPVGGPFSITTQTYVLTHAGATALTWTCATAAPWLSLSVTNGILPAGSSALVTVSLNAMASNLTAGIYSATVRFTDLITAYEQSREFRLLVGQPLVQNSGFETGDFTGWTLSGNTTYTSISANSAYVHAGSYSALMGPVGSPVYLTQSLMTVPGLCYLLSFWLNSPNNSAPSAFQVRWNGVLVFDQANIGAIGWTNLQLVVAATSTVTTLQFGCRNDPWYFSLDDVCVEPLASTNAPRLWSLTVFSSMGGASPGSAIMPNGSTLIEQIVNSPVVNGGTRQVCTGASVTGNSFSQTSPTNVTLTLTNNATLTWSWQTQYLLTTAVSGTGTITPGGWQVSGDSVVLTATADARAHFVNWSGNTNGCLIAGNVLTAPMTQARSITATFAAGALPIISGRITKSGVGVAGVLLAFSNGGGTTTTDSNGYYSRTMPYSWTGTVTPSTNSIGGAFSPAGKSYRNLTSQKNGQNFKWIPPPVISGTVKRAGTSVGASGIVLTFPGVGTTTTDNNGNYAMTVPYNWTGAVTPSSVAGGVFSPAVKTYSTLKKNKARQNYTWTTPAVLPVPAAAAVATVTAAPAAPVVLLRTSGTARWSGAAAAQVWQAPELLYVIVSAGETKVVLPVAVPAPEDLVATIAVEPDLQSLRDPSETMALVIRNQNGLVTADTPLPNAGVLDTVTILFVDDAVVLTWDLTVLQR